MIIVKRFSLHTGSDIMILLLKQVLNLGLVLFCFSQLSKVHINKLKEMSI